MNFKVILFLILALVVGGLYYLSAGYYSSGERAGTISKFSDKGFVFKTWEGLLNEGGYSDGTGAMNRKEWEFSVTQDSVVTKLKQALRTGGRVTLLYKEKFVKFPWNGDTKYYITDVMFIDRPNEPANGTIPPTASPIEKIDTVRQILVIDTVRK
jgi:hypothetical protein